MAGLAVEAAFAAGVPVVDTTQGTSYPVAEWALALALIALKVGIVPHSCNVYGESLVQR